MTAADSDAEKPRRFAVPELTDDDETPVQRLEFDPEDPWQDVPLLVRLICGCLDPGSEPGILAPQVRAALRNPAWRFEHPSYVKPDELVQQLDELRYAAVRDQSTAIAEVADRVLWRWSMEVSHPYLTRRLTVRLQEVIGSIHAGPRTVAGRAVRIAEHRLALLRTLGGEGPRLLRQPTGDNTFEALLQPLRELLENASASLTDEIEACIEQLRIERAIEEGIAVLDVLEDTTPAREPPVLAIDDEEAVGADDAETEDENERVLVLPGLPIGTTREQKKLVEPFNAIAGEHLPLIATPDLVPVRRQLETQLPHLAAVIDQLLRPLAGRRSVGLPPTLLVGPPGCGKTTLAEELCRLLGVPNVTVDAAGIADAMLMGSSRKWTNAAPGVPLSMILEHRVGNPAIVIDELEKLGGSDSNGDLRLMLLGAFEPRRARRFLDRHLEVETDISRIVWLGTANTLDGLSAPLRNRMRVLTCPLPGLQHLAVLAPQLLHAHYRNLGLDPRWAAPLSIEELQMLAAYWRGGSLRDLGRYVAGIVTVRDQALGRA